MALKKKRQQNNVLQTDRNSSITVQRFKCAKMTFIFFGTWKWGLNIWTTFWFDRYVQFDHLVATYSNWMHLIATFFGQCLEKSAFYSIKLSIWSRMRWQKPVESITIAVNRIALKQLQSLNYSSNLVKNKNVQAHVTSDILSQKQWAYGIKSRLTFTSRQYGIIYGGFSCAYDHST